MPNISGYAVRTSVAVSDRIFVATAGSDIIQSCTLGQVVGLASGGSGLAYAPGWGKSYASGSWARPALSAFSTFGGTIVTATDIAGGPIRTTYSGGSGVWAGCKIATPGATWTLQTLLTMDGVSSATGLVLVNSTTGNFIAFVVNWANDTVYVQHWSGFWASSSFVANPFSTTPTFNPRQIHMRVTFDGTNLRFFLAHDPIDDAAWQGVYAEAASTYVGTVDTVGFGANSSAPEVADVNAWGWTLITP